MTEENKKVFGISTGVFREDHPFGFVNVYAYIVDDHLELITNPYIDFPKRGSFFLPERLGIPEEGEGGIWQVKKQPDYLEDESNEYTAASKQELPPYEIIKYPLASDNPDAIRRQLMNGFKFSYKPMRRVLVALTDNTLIGPLEFIQSVDRNIYVCLGTAFAKPLKHWLNPDLLNPVECTIGRETRTFSGKLSLPPNESYLDCSELHVSVKSLLNYYHKIAGNKRLLSKRNIKEIGDLIKENDNPENIAATFKKVETTLKRIAETGDNLEELDEYLFANDNVKSYIKKAAEAKVEEVKNRILEEKVNLDKDLTELKYRKQSTLSSVKKLEKQKEVISSDIEDILEAATQTFQEKLKKAKNSPEQLIGEILILKPFMNAHSTDSFRATTITSQEEIKALDDLNKAVEIVSNNLHSIGIRATYANKLSAEIVSTMLTGQMVCFSGLLAPLFDQAICTGLSGEKSICISIPARPDISSAFETELDTAIKTWELNDNLLAVSIKGVNHSSFEIFGNKLIEKVISDSCISANRNSLMLIGTLSDGPSTYPVGDALLSIGPIFDVGNLPMINRKRTGSIQTGSLTKEAINVFRKQEINSGYPMALEDHLKEFGTFYNSYFRKSMRNLESMLRRVLAIANAKTPEEVEDQAILDSLCIGWIIPKIEFCCEDKKVIEDLKNLLSDSEDERIISKLRDGF